MPNQFVARNGIISKGDLIVTGSLTSTNGFTGSFSGSTSAPGLTTQVTYNNNGVLSADSGFVYSGSNVGIGTTVPTEKLQIDGSSILAGSTLSKFYKYQYGSGFAIWAMGGADGFDIKRESSTYFSISSGGNVRIGTTTSTAKLQVKGSGTTSATTAFRVENANASGSMVVLDDGNVGIGTNTPNTQLDLVGQYKQTSVSGVMGLYHISTSNANQVRGVWDFYTNTAVTPDFFGRFGFKFEGGTADSFKQYQIHVADSTTPKMVVNGAGNVGIGLTTPSASLHVSGNVLLGSISDPALFTSQVVTANTGVTTIYALPTSSYEGAFFDYTIRSGSNSRAGQIMGLWSGSSVNYTEVTTLDFGNTSGFNFGMSVSSSNMILSSSATTSGWTVRTIIRSM